MEVNEKDLLPRRALPPDVEEEMYGQGKTMAQVGEQMRGIYLLLGISVPLLLLATIISLVFFGGNHAH